MSNNKVRHPEKVNKPINPIKKKNLNGFDLKLLTQKYFLKLNRL